MSIEVLLLRNRLLHHAHLLVSAPTNVARQSKQTRHTPSTCHPPNIVDTQPVTAHTITDTVHISHREKWLMVNFWDTPRFAWALKTLRTTKSALSQSSTTTTPPTRRRRFTSLVPSESTPHQVMAEPPALSLDFWVFAAALVVVSPSGASAANQGTKLPRQLS